ncbi:MAG: hypothetical protein WD226_06950 [Planctomycetota bacterium]
MLDHTSFWCEGRSPWARALLWVWLAWLGIRYVADPEAATLFDGLNLGIHEAGHLVFAWAGAFVCAAGGTLLQLAAPLAAAWMFLRQPDFFAVTVAGAWLATNLFGVATYVGDARARSLPLVTVGGGEASHDWHYLLGELGCLEQDALFASLLRAAAFACYFGSLVAGAWLLAKMLRASRTA